MDKVRQLLGASEEGDISTVTTVLGNNTDVNACDSDDTTALQVASANGHEHIVRLLIMKGATLDLANSMGWTPLLLACRHSHVNVVSILLQNRADINAETKLGANALTLASRGGHLNICKLLIESGIDLSPSTAIGTAACEFTALMGAAHHGHDTVVRYLIDHRFDVNYRTPSMGMNALMLAALNGHMATCQILIERGADPNLTNVNNATPLQIATESRKRELAGYLERKTTNKPKEEREEVKPDIIEAAKKGNLNRIREILDKDLTQRDVASSIDGATPLMFAAMQGRLDIAQLLVEKGCDIDKQDVSSGWTALMQAVYHGKKSVAKYLINAGANVLISAKNQCTAFDMASLIDDIDTDLYRLIAAKAVHINHPGTVSNLNRQGSKSMVKVNGAAAGATSEPSNEQLPKNGLKAWWNRFSARFRNLKLGGTMKTSNKLSPAPSPAGGASGGEDNNNRKTPNHNPKPSSGSPSVARKTVRDDALGTTNASNISTIKSYESMMLETRNSAPVFTLHNGPVQHIAEMPPPGVAAASASTMSEYSLRSVIPPFLPPPTFDDDRPKMPPITNRRSMASMASGATMSSSSTIIPPTKLLQNYSSTTSVSTQNLANMNTSPSSSGSSSAAANPKPKYPSTSDDISPSSSGGASQLTSASKKSQESKGPSSASSSTLTAGSGSRYIQVNPPDYKGNSSVTSAKPLSFLSAHHQQFFYKRSGPGLVRSSHSPGSSVSALSAVSSGKHSSAAKSNSSKDTNSTLTPSSSPLKPSKGTSSKTSKSSLSTSEPTTSSVTDSQATITKPSQPDDLGSILKKLSLESYKPIFEEQEVDMEAFLTLSDDDLKEIGINHQEPRRQILTAISELNTGKGRERQHLQETMNSYNSLRSQGSVENFANWQMNGSRPSTSTPKS